MDDNYLNKFVCDIKEFKDRSENKAAMRLNLRLTERIVKRLHSFDCERCEKYLIELYDHFKMLMNKKEELEKHDFKEHKRKVNEIISHLQKEHKLVMEGYYLSIYMSMGTSFGLIFGLLLFDNLALGLPIGISIGIAIGSAMDVDAKKKGLTI